MLSQEVLATKEAINRHADYDSGADTGPGINKEVTPGKLNSFPHQLESEMRSANYVEGVKASSIV